MGGVLTVGRGADFAFHYRRRKRYIRRKKGKGKKQSRNKQEEEQRYGPVLADILSICGQHSTRTELLK